MGLEKTDFLITDTTNPDMLFCPVIDGESKGTGLVPRDYAVYPTEYLGPPSEMQVIPQSEWSDLIKEQERTKSRLSDIRGNMPSLDQGSVGYCWSHSTAHCVMLARLAANQPHVPLSAYSVASTIKNGRDEGGWCGLSLKFMKERGIAPQSVWPQGNRSKRWDESVATEAIKFQVTEDYYDLARQEWSQQMTFEQVATCLLVGIPVALDFNWWGHSVCGMDLVEISAGNFGIRILNSWSDSWGDRGAGVLEGSKARPNGAVGVRVSKAA